MSGEKEGACLVCGAPLVYFDAAKTLVCADCGGSFKAYATCENGHFICDACHSARAVCQIIDYCKKTDEKDPVSLAVLLMGQSGVHMHGPEHHVLVGAALLTAYANGGGKIALDKALAEMAERGGQYPGGSCGYWGCCGAAVSVGMAVSILLEATPLSVGSWSLANGATAAALARISAIGGPRCCKRDTFAALEAAIDYFREKLQFAFPSGRPVCGFSAKNRECRRKSCPYYAD
ncbi:MAG: SAM-dependent methyltransferase [Christensenellaceae bacterium]|nr:SAM-dependent methyltransferase [Christensenellaceae bacterium]